MGADGRGRRRRGAETRASCNFALLPPRTASITVTRGEAGRSGAVQRGLRLIAHRVFDDRAGAGAPLLALPGFDGVELDLRCGPGGEPVVEHGPLFLSRALRRRRAPASLAEALASVEQAAPGVELALLDVKSREAAEAAGRWLAANPPRLETVFVCWHGEVVRALRRLAPAARILFCVAPIFGRRAPRGRLRDLYLHNAFPFVATSRRYEPRREKPNGHAINLKLISSRAPRAALPGGLHGLCVHRLFCSAELAAFCAARGLRLAVYGLDDAADARLDRIAGVADYAIIRGRRPWRGSVPPPAASSSPDTALCA
jgi:hypothetical protein